MNFGIVKKFKIVILISCLFIPSVRNEVSPLFQNCRLNFFLNGYIPQGFPQDGDQSIMNICQRYMGKYRFATLYSVRHRIPIYSAYSILESLPIFGNYKRPKKWFIEPQVSDKTVNEIDMKIANNETTYREKQAVESDMKHNGLHVYDRGHLSPCSYHFTKEAKDATFTLTNMVPQFKNFNCPPWAKAEQNTWNITRDHCIGSLRGRSYFITGAIPSDYNLFKGRVNIPTEMWTAVCCEGNDENQTYTYGFYRSNENSTEKVILTDLSSLQNRLEKLYAYNRGAITLFDGKCNKKTQEVPDLVKTTFQSDVTPYVC